MGERSDAYEDRISHLRSGLRLIRDHVNDLHTKLGLPPGEFVDVLLDEDVGRSVAMDSLTDGPGGG